MRYLVALIVLGGAALAGWLVFSKTTADHGKLIGVAFGVPDGDNIEMHTIISSRMHDVDPPQMNLQGQTLWQDWVDAHFTMKDTAGTQVPLKYKKSTDIIPDLDLRGFPHGFVVAHLKQGMEYTMQYRPTRAATQRYSHDFTAPTGDQALSRPNFEPMD